MSVSGVVICALSVQLTRVRNVFLLLIFFFKFFFCLIISKTTDIFALFNYASLLFVLVLLIYLPCYFGALIMVKSNQLLTDAYLCNWMRMAIVHRKIIITFQERLKGISSILIGRLFLLGLDTFSAVNHVFLQFLFACNLLFYFRSPIWHFVCLQY